MDLTGTTASASGLPAPPARGVGKLLAKRLRRSREPPAPGIKRHATFAGDLSDTAASSSSDVALVVVDTEEADGSDLEAPSPAALSRPRVLPSARTWQIEYTTTSSPPVQAADLQQPASRSEPSLALEIDTGSHTSAQSRPPSTSSKLDPRGPDSDRRSRSRTRKLATAPHSPPSISVSPAGRFHDIFAKRSSTGGRPGQAASASSVIRPDPDIGPRRPSAERPLSRPRSNLSARSSLSAVDRPTTPASNTAGTVEASPLPAIINTPPTPTFTGFESPQKSEAPQPPQAPGTHNKATSFVPKPPVLVAQTNKGGSSPRRSHTDSASLVPSKLSTATRPPPTPDPEARPVAWAGTPAAGTPATGGFFLSIVTVAQNAASTISSSIIPPNAATAAALLPKTPTANAVGTRAGASAFVASPSKMDVKDSAVSTLGSGDLSLSQLGLADPASSEPERPATTWLAGDGPEPRQRPRPESGHHLLPAAPIGDLGTEDVTTARGRSSFDPSSSITAFNELSSPPGSVYEEKSGGGGGLGRSSSLKSPFGRRGRNHGSSNTTGVSSQASASATNLASSALATAAAVASSAGPRLTGFAIASKKRNRDFHGLFKSVPDDDYLIEDYSCAIQREILAHGRLYVSEGHLCFSSNIFGWVTTLVMSFSEIVSVEKRSTALVFKNGLTITTLHAKHVFASFTSRDATYDLIVNIWKLGHPSLQSSLNGVRLDGTGGDKTEKLDAPATLVEQDEGPTGSGTDDESEEEEEDVYDEDAEEEEDVPDVTQATDASMVDIGSDKAISRKSSGTAALGVTAAEPPPSDAFPATASATAEFPGPATHAPTDCGDSATHYDRVVADEIVPAPLGQVYAKLFGPESATWVAKWLQGDQKCTDLQMEDEKGLTPDNKTRTLSYTKPLYSSFGPRSTKCIVTETLNQFDLEKAVSVSCSTLTPDVPSGNVFSTKTKYCLTWAENNSTRLQASCAVEWTGKSWIKGPIEKGSNDGQTQYCKDLVASLKAAVARPRSGTGSGGVKTGKARKKAGRKTPQSPTDSSDGQARASQRSAGMKENWGPLEPVRSLLESVTDMVKPLLSSNVFYGLLVGVFVAWWFGSSFAGRSVRPREGISDDSPGFLFAGFPDRIAAYEEMWRRDEGDLLEWLDERIGLARIAVDSDPPSSSLRRVKSNEPKTLDERLRQERIEGRELEEAIRATEERLRVLQEVVKRSSV